LLAQTISFRERAGAWTVRGSVSPSAAGGIDLEFSLLDARGAPPDAPVDTAVALTMQEHAMPPVAVRPLQLGRGSYRARVALPMAGRWQLAIRLPGGTVTTELSTRRSSAPAGSVAWGRILPGLLSLLLGASCVLLIMRREMRPVWRWPAVGVGLAAMVTGLALGVRVLTAGAPTTAVSDRPNPVAPTAASIAAGERVYRQYCQSCHGVVGAGDGPAAFALRPRPADLRVHMAAGHTDGQLYYWISEGFQGTAMPAFKDTLSDEERWNAVNFIRTFALRDR
jgi:mono/diheme cytochrome c family protein